MRVCILGAGIGGLTAAYDLARQGYHVTVAESAPVVGGLASGFRDSRWEWPLERFYHHLFETDTALRKLVDEIDFTAQLFFKKPITAQWYQGRGYPLDGALPVLRYPGLPLLDRLRLGVSTAWLKYVDSNWQALEQVTAADYIRKHAGEKVYEAIWRPLLVGKFGPYADQVNMAWLWARLRARSFQLGYFTGGFQAFADALLGQVIRHGADVRLDTPVHTLTQLAEGWQVQFGSATEPFDAVLVTGAPALLRRLVPTLPPEYLGGVDNLRSMGAVVLTVALKHPLTGGLYWVNTPKDQFPFLALVEHTNFVDRQHYGGDHLIYCGDYLEPSHEYFQMSKTQLLERFMPAFKQVNPAFDPSWVRDVWLHREAYAQPIVTVGHSKNIPPIGTPLPGLFWASMSQVYPWDRGTNFAVEIGRNAAAELTTYATRIRMSGGGVGAIADPVWVRRTPAPAPDAPAAPNTPQQETNDV